MENDEKDDGMSEKWFDAGRGNIEVCCYCTRSFHRDVICGK